MSEQHHYTEEEINCESHFLDNFYRDESGRFIVSLPFREICQLGESKDQAIKRFYAVERKLQRNQVLYEQYKEFMKEYETLNHMKQIRDDESNNGGYYLPHHSVMKTDSLTTKLRVVFDASAKTTNNLSLNDVLMVGPCIQNSLFSILIRFRKHNVVLIADVAKMYRQILINQNDRKFQKIVWRENPNDNLNHFELQTVTYGTGPASFLATRCLKQLAIEAKPDFPVVSDIILNDFYMDDLLSGAVNVDDAVQIKRDLEYILSNAGLSLRKWISNNPTVFRTTDDNNCLKDTNYIISEDEKIKTLGISWNSKGDNFYISLNDDMMQQSNTITKRTILSTVARIYDPLGLISCVVIIAKCILQALWKNNIGWDDSVPPDLTQTWFKFCSQLPSLNKLCIPRQITLTNYTSIQLHGYCDSSEIAYGAVLYLKTTNNDTGDVAVNLICAKSRVAPVKSLTLPKLELCGAVLLAKLVKETVAALKLDIQEVFYWCDSSIVLAWISGHPSNWKTFVGNRVSDIQQLTDKTRWRHVPTMQNPADIITRGCSPVDLLENTLWWHGPQYLSKSEAYWPKNIQNNQASIPETKTKTQITLTMTNSFNIFELFSSYSKLRRVMAYCLRFVNRLKAKNNKYLSINLTTDELHIATLKLVQLAQREEFVSDIQCLEKSNQVSRKSKLASLNPFLDDNKIIRVGGRLRHCDMNFDRKYPMVLPTKHSLTKLLIEYEHQRNLHTGPQHTLASLRRQFWPLKGKQAIRSVLRKCIPCFKAKPPSTYPQMGDLPSYRVKVSRVFYSVGTDFAGPYLVKDGKLRNRKLVKSYFCIFICLTTKAVHLEPVGDLSTDNFLNALQRFVARRGLCKHIYSDNATNYVGANRELTKLFNLNNDDTFQSYLSEHQIEWHFIPARSPHFGGIWESAVKSAKHHFKRVAGNIHFTYEQFHTLLTQIEAIMNSRPLVPLSNDPSDLEALTPGHFLIGQALNNFPSIESNDRNLSHISRFHHLQLISRHFWQRWSHDYLHTLQERTRWKFNSKDQVAVGTLVLLKEDNLPPQRWHLGRILQLFPGADGVVRVVSVKTAQGVVKRAVARVCILPVD